MLSLDDIKSNFALNERVVKIKAWSGEVKLRDLNTAEYNQILSVAGVSASDDKLKNELDIAKLVKSQMLCASLALVEPKLSLKEIESLNKEAFAGISEIYSLVMEGAKKK